MTDREQRLRQRIDVLTDQRDVARAQLRSLGITRIPHGCVYCGEGPTKGRPRTCHNHRDLPALDPNYATHPQGLRVVRTEGTVAA